MDVLLKSLKDIAEHMKETFISMFNHACSILSVLLVCIATNFLPLWVLIVVAVILGGVIFYWTFRDHLEDTKDEE